MSSTASDDVEAVSGERRHQPMSLTSRHVLLVRFVALAALITLLLFLLQWMGSGGSLSGRDASDLTVPEREQGLSTLADRNIGCWWANFNLYNAAALFVATIGVETTIVAAGWAICAGTFAALCIGTAVIATVVVLVACIVGIYGASSVTATPGSRSNRAVASSLAGLMISHVLSGPSNGTVLHFNNDHSIGNLTLMPSTLTFQHVSGANATVIGGLLNWSRNSISMIHSVFIRDYNDGEYMGISIGNANATIGDYHQTFSKQINNQRSVVGGPLGTSSGGAFVSYDFNDVSHGYLHNFSSVVYAQEWAGHNWDVKMNQFFYDNQAAKYCMSVGNVGEFGTYGGIYFDNQGGVDGQCDNGNPDVTQDW